MDFVYCPNGHANRPGTRICIVCRALVEQRASSIPTEAPSPSPRTSVTGQVETIDAGRPPATREQPRRNRSLLWLVLLFLLLAALALVAILATILPFNRTAQEQPTPRIESTAVILVEATALPIPTTTQEPTATVDNPPTATTISNEDLPTAVPTITPLSTIIGVVITPTFSFGPGTNLLQNGDFASDWANGWTSETTGDSGVIESRPMQSEPDVGTLHLEKSGPGYLKVAQRVVLTYPVEGLEFQARIQASGKAAGTAESRGALILQYEDVNGDPLGASIWLDGSAESTSLWNTAGFAIADIPIVERTLDESWQTLGIDMGREFAEELDGVNPIDVRQITIILALLGSDGCNPADCGATLDVAELSLAPILP